MIDIIARGKKTNDGDWVEGYYVYLKDPKRGIEEHRIYTGYAEVEDRPCNCHKTFPEYFEVDPETVGRCLGLTDKNGVKIFEGDIVKHYYKSLVGDPVSDKGVVKWDCEECMYYMTSVYYGRDNFINSRNVYEVIGNIYDNPELVTREATED